MYRASLYRGPSPSPRGHQTWDPFQPRPCPLFKLVHLRTPAPPTSTYIWWPPKHIQLASGRSHPTEILFGFNFRHGGPGGGTGPRDRRFFDPSVYRIVLMDQRGAGKSLPPAELKVQYLCFLCVL